jgi:hypothetical protein
MILAPIAECDWNTADVADAARVGEGGFFCSGGLLRHGAQRCAPRGIRRERTYVDVCRFSTIPVRLSKRSHHSRVTEAGTGVRIK